ncbi:unnamed protein product, partial [Discosporangium mesarthrocarpum]
QVLIDTAESNGVQWRDETRRLLQNQDRLEEIYQTVVDWSLVERGYPEYYTRPFHAYPDGNLNWLAAAECESATFAMANRIWPKEGLGAQEAQLRLRESYMDFIMRFSQEQEARPVEDILEVGVPV